MQKKNSALQIEYKKMRYQEYPEILTEQQKRGTKKRRNNFRIFSVS